MKHLQKIMKMLKQQDVAEPCVEPASPLLDLEAPTEEDEDTSL